MNKNISKNLSRLAAIQSFFQSIFLEKSINLIAIEFNEFRLKKILDSDNINLKYEKNYYQELISYIEKFHIDYNINEYFSKYIKTKRPYKRLDKITKSILVVASSEIIYKNKIKKKIIINDYIDIAKSFLDRPEVSMINAVLDKIYESKKNKKE